jgi:hypothetical protein
LVSSGGKCQAREDTWETAEEIGQRAAKTVHEMAEDLKRFKQDQSDSVQRDLQRNSEPLKPAAQLAATCRTKAKNIAPKSRSRRVIETAKAATTSASRSFEDESSAPAGPF